MANSNFGTLFTIAGVSGNVISVSAPQLQKGIIETTNHSSAGWRSYIVDRLAGGASFQVTWEVSTAVVAAVVTVWTTGAPVACVFTEFGLPAWSFNGIISNIDLGSHDAKSPAEEIIVVTIQPTAGVTIAAGAGDWYDGMTSVFTDVGGALAITSTEEKQLVIYAIINGSIHTVSTAEMADLTMASTVEADATISATGLVEGVSTGASVITIFLTSDADINTEFTVTLAS